MSELIVYIDILFILNLFVNYFILLAAEKLCRTDTRFYRRLLSAALGGLYSMSIFIEINFIISLILRIVFAASMVLAAFGYRNIKRFLRLIAALFCVSFIYAGIMMAVWLIIKPSNMVVNNGVVYFNISPVILIVSTLVCYLLLMIIKKVMKKPLSSSKFYSISVSSENKTIILKALLDTGHALTDIFSDLPVIVAEYASVKDIIPHGAENYFQFKNGIETVPDELKNRIRLIPYKSVGGSGILPGFIINNVGIIYNDYTNIVKKAIIAVSAESVGDGYNALISNDLIFIGSESGHAAKTDVENKIENTADIYKIKAGK